MLKYLFQVTYKDNSTYQQNPEDISVSDSAKSCYSDVKQEQVKSFFLFNDDHTYSVNLEDGHFEVDGVPFLMHDENDGVKDFKLVFWRRHTHDIEVNTEKNKEVRHIIVYRFGWEAINRKGQNIQQIMQIN